MNLSDINQKIEENKMDIQSPYIKNDSNSIDEVRKRITKRAIAGDFTDLEGSVLSFKNKENIPESDDLLKQKISNVSKKVVGEEIKRFAEIASREIGKEFVEIEERLNLNIKSNAIDLQNEIDKKIEKFNFNIKELENRIRDLEIISIENLKKEEARSLEKEDAVKKAVDILKEMREEIKNSQKEKDVSKEELQEKKEEIKNIFIEKESVDKKEQDSNKDVKKYYEALELREEENNYIENKIKELNNLFEKSGLLFKKNSYSSKLKNLNTETFLNNWDGEEYKNIDSQDKEKMVNLLIELMDKLNIDPSENEKIEDFIKRCYRIEFQNINS